MPGRLCKRHPNHSHGLTHELKTIIPIFAALALFSPSLPSQAQTYNDASEIRRRYQQQEMERNMREMERTMRERQMDRARKEAHQMDESLIWP